MKEINPRIIYASIERLWLLWSLQRIQKFRYDCYGHGSRLQPHGSPRWATAQAAPDVGDTGTGLHTAIGILSAYIQRFKTGKGQRVDLHAGVGGELCAGGLREHYTTGKPVQRIGVVVVIATSPAFRHPGGANDYVFIVGRGLSERVWNELLKVMDREDLIGDARYQPCRPGHAA